MPRFRKENTNLVGGVMMIMKRALVVLSVGALGMMLSLVVVSFGFMSSAAFASQAGSRTRTEDAPASAGKEWTLIGGDRGNTHYSTLSQINRRNVKNLGGVWISKKF